MGMISLFPTLGFNLIKEILMAEHISLMHFKGKLYLYLVLFNIQLYE